MSFSQFKLQDIPYNLEDINKIDNKGKQGIWYYYYKEDSTVYLMENYRNDTLNGYFERYWKNGQISAKGYYKDGKFDSIFIAYWENGQELGISYYKNGKLNGVALSFDQNGKIKIRQKYIDGQIDSSYAEEYIDSTLIFDNSIRNKIDTVITYWKYTKWNKIYSIYINDTLSKEINFYNDRPGHINFYERAELYKRVVYSRKKPYHIEKIFYFQNDLLIKKEEYDKHGNLVDKK